MPQKPTLEEFSPESGRDAVTVKPRKILGKTTGSVFPSLSAPDIKKFAILKPHETLVLFYEQITHPLVEMIEEHQRQTLTLAALRDTLLPKLLSRGMMVRY